MKLKEMQAIITERDITKLREFTIDDLEKILRVVHAARSLVSPSPFWAQILMDRLKDIE